MFGLLMKRNNIAIGIILVGVISAYGFFSLRKNHLPIVTIQPITQEIKDDVKPTEPVVAQPEEQIAHLSNGYALGFNSLNTEHHLNNLVVEGTIPSWLKGSYIAVGPGKFELGSTKSDHWLDGFGMIHKFTITNGTASYTNKLVNSSYYTDSVKQGSMIACFPDPNKSMFSKLAGAFSAERREYDNTNVNVIQMNGTCMCLTETPKPLTFDTDSLETKQPHTFNDAIEGHFSSAHPIYDLETKEWFNFVINYGRTSTYTVFSCKEGSTTRIKRGETTTSYPSYMHSFCLTKNYVVLMHIPFVVNPYDLILKSQPFIENFVWKPKQGTQFYVFNRHNGKLEATITTKAFFALHQINAFETNGQIVIDVVAYKNPDIIKTFYLEPIRSHKHSIAPKSKIKRFFLDPVKKSVTTKTMHKVSLEMPRINNTMQQSSHRYVYAMSSNKPSSPNKLVKIDLQTGAKKSWSMPNCYPSEPTFIAHPDKTTEDHGIIASIVLDARKQQSFLVLLDAQTFSPIAKAWVPHHVPFIVHGNFFN